MINESFKTSTMNPPKPYDYSEHFIRLRVNRSFETQLKELGQMLGHTSMSQTTEYLLTRNLANEILIARRLLGRDKDIEDS